METFLQQLCIADRSCVAVLKELNPPINKEKSINNISFLVQRIFSYIYYLYGNIFNLRIFNISYNLVHFDNLELKVIN